MLCPGSDTQINGPGILEPDVCAATRPGSHRQTGTWRCAHTHNHLNLTEMTPNEYGEGLAQFRERKGGIVPWSHWATFTWRPRTELVSTRPTKEEKRGHLVRRYDTCRSPRTIISKQDDPISLPAIRRAMSRYCYRVKPETIFWATESGDRFGRHHVHALIRMTDKRLEIVNPWEIAYRWFGYAQVEEYDFEKGAAFYVSKYVTKQLADHDIWTRRKGYD